MLSQSIRDAVRATAPLLQENGVTLTRHFYARMFRGNPELREVFNQGHQHGGQQQRALAAAVAAYAQHIDDPSVLAPVLTRIAHKHVSLGIRAEHYAIVGRHLLASIREVLGEELATDALIDAWAAAYGQLADLLVAEEARLYRDSVQRPGGWSGWRSFVVRSRRHESAEIVSFELVPADGGTVPAYIPGQYVSVRVFVPALGFMQARQYSLSDAPGGDCLRISVKREAGGPDSPDGMVSSRLHEAVAQGDVIEVAPPMGDFQLHDRPTPVVLLSGGVGLTPMVAMLNHLVAGDHARQIRFVHGCRGAEVHAMKAHVNAIARQRDNVRKIVFYEQVREQDRSGEDYDHVGRMDLHRIRDAAILPDADYYLCGPLPFMGEQQRVLRELGVPAERIHAEAFGSGGPGA